METQKTTAKDKIFNALMYLLKRKKFSEIYVKDICTVACIHRSSFYEHYSDINDLMIKTEERLSKGIAEIFDSVKPFDRESFIKFFEHIGKHRDFYRAYLNYGEPQIMGQNDFVNFLNRATKSGAVQKDLDFHMAFFAGGLQAVCNMWILTDLKKTPEQMADIIFDEYKNNAKYFVD